mgnify:CR=1 FL=1
MQSLLQAAPKMAGICLALVSIAIALRLLKRSIRNATQHITEKGYLPPAPSSLSQYLIIPPVQFLTWLIVGRLQIKGSRNLDLMPKDASYIVAPNHSHYADIFIMPLVLRHRKTRYMADSGVMESLWGLVGLVFAYFGTYTASLQAAVKLMSTGQNMVIFPEGWTYLDGKMGKCKSGAVTISKLAAKELKTNTYIVPVGISYRKYPGSWIRNYSIRLQYLILTAGIIFFRRGARVTVGEPIACSDLPEDDSLATEFVAGKIQALLTK